MNRIHSGNKSDFTYRWPVDTFNLPITLIIIWGFTHSLVGKESACHAGDPGLIPGLEKSAGEGIGYPLQYSWASLVAQLVKSLPAMWETWVRSLGWKIPWRRERQPTPVFWPGEFHGQRNLAGYIQSMGSQRIGHDWVTFTTLIIYLYEI